MDNYQIRNTKTSPLFVVALLDTLIPFTVTRDDLVAQVNIVRDKVNSLYGNYYDYANLWLELVNELCDLRGISDG